MDQGRERRRFPRHPIIIDIHYQTDSPVLRARLSDLSEGGMFVDTVNPLPPGTEVKFRFRLPSEADAPPLIGLGRVAWNQPTVGMGIEFIRFSADGLDRLRAFWREGS
ncbi:MAG TPA: PilZ domain-containing protein [Candidatus Methanoperedens sp.]|nr:PilZ domain-containing protein [Candidatus Methanoperedens sp.]